VDRRHPTGLAKRAYRPTDLLVPSGRGALTAAAAGAGRAAGLPRRSAAGRPVERGVDQRQREQVKSTSRRGPSNEGSTNEALASLACRPPARRCEAGAGGASATGSHPPPSITQPYQHLALPASALPPTPQPYPQHSTTMLTAATSRLAWNKVRPTRLLPARSARPLPPRAVPLTTSRPLPPHASLPLQVFRGRSSKASKLSKASDDSLKTLYDEACVPPLPRSPAAADGASSGRHELTPSSLPDRPAARQPARSGSQGQGGRLWPA
jgi:hypothetical protein